jgi:hypothetical protein
MNQVIIETKIQDGKIALSNLPLSDDTEVRVIVIPKINLEKMGFLKSLEYTREIKGNLSEDVVKERGER